MLKKILMGLGVIVLVAIIAAFLYPTEMKYSGSVQIDAPASQVWPHVSTLKGMDSWSPWSAKDPNIKQTWEGEDGTVGASNCWESEVENVGKGCQTISDLEENVHVGTDLSFTAPNPGEAVSNIDLVEKDGGTEVTWSFSSEMPRPFNLMMMMYDMDKMMGDDWNKGLGMLKDLAEVVPEPEMPVMSDSTSMDSTSMEVETM